MGYPPTTSTNSLMTQAAASHWNLQAKALALLRLLHREDQQPLRRQAPQGLAKDRLQSGHLQRQTGAWCHGAMVPWCWEANQNLETGYSFCWKIMVEHILTLEEASHTSKSAALRWNLSVSSHAPMPSNINKDIRCGDQIVVDFFVRSLMDMRS